MAKKQEIKPPKHLDGSLDDDFPEKPYDFFETENRPYAQVRQIDIRPKYWPGAFSSKISCQTWYERVDFQERHQRLRQKVEQFLWIHDEIFKRHGENWQNDLLNLERTVEEGIEENSFEK